MKKSIIFCKKCKYFYDGNAGQFCRLLKFEGQYTKTCPKREIIKTLDDF